MAKTANSVCGTKPADETAPVETAQHENKFPVRGALATLAIFAMSMILLAFPAQASTPDINLTWVGTMFASLVNAFNLCATPVQNLIETWFPVVIEIVIYGGIIGVIGLFLYAVRGTILAGIRMLERVFDFK